MYRNREQLATRWAHFFKKRRAYRRRFRFWHHIPHTVLWPACLPGNPIIPRSSGTRHSFGLRPPAGGTRSIRPIPVSYTHLFLMCWARRCPPRRISFSWIGFCSDAKLPQIRATGSRAKRPARNAAISALPPKARAAAGPVGMTDCSFCNFFMNGLQNLAPAV